MLRTFRAWKIALLEARVRRHPVAGVLWSFAHGGEGQEGSGEYREDQGDREETAVLQGCREDQGDREEAECREGCSPREEPAVLQGDRLIRNDDEGNEGREGCSPREEDDGNHKACFKDGGVHGGHAAENRSGRSVSDGEHRYSGVHRKCRGDHDGDDGDDDGGVHQQYRGDRAGDDGDHEGDGVDERDGGDHAPLRRCNAGIDESPDDVATRISMKAAAMTDSDYSSADTMELPPKKKVDEENEQVDEEEEEERELVRTWWDEGALKCRRCGSLFVPGIGSYSEPMGGTKLGHCEGGLCWVCVDVLALRRKTKFKKGWWTQGMVDRMQQEEDELDKMEEEKEKEEKLQQEKEKEEKLQQEEEEKEKEQKLQQEEEEAEE